MEKGRGPLRGLFIGWRFGRVVWLGVAGAVEHPDGVGLQLDDELLNDVLDGLLAIGDFDGPVVLAGVELALHEDVCAALEAWGQFGKTFSPGGDVVPLGLVFPLSAVAATAATRASTEHWWTRCGLLRDGQCSQSSSPRASRQYPLAANDKDSFVLAGQP